MKECISKVTGLRRLVATLRSPTERAVRPSHRPAWAITEGCLTTTRAIFTASSGNGVPEKLIPPK